MEAGAVIERLKSFSDSRNVEGMARFGINPAKTLGIKIPVLRRLAKEIGKNHDLALQLWDSGYHEARILASMIDDYKQVDEGQMEKWVGDFDSWDVCDQCAMNLFIYSDLAWIKAVEWSRRPEEFVKRAGFAIMACLAWKNKQAPDERFKEFLPIMKKEANDNRNFVKKAINWALRQIGKRNLNLNKETIKMAEEIQAMGDKSAKWIASDALKELTSEAVQKRFFQCLPDIRRNR